MKCQANKCRPTTFSAHHDAARRRDNVKQS